MSRPKPFKKDKICQMSYSDFFKYYHKEIANQTNYDNIIVIMRCYEINESKARKLYNNWKEKYMHSMLF